MQFLTVVLRDGLGDKQDGRSQRGGQVGEQAINNSCSRRCRCRESAPVTALFLPAGLDVVHSQCRLLLCVNM